MTGWDSRKGFALACLGSGLVLSACGIKNEPVAPSTGRTPQAVVEPERGGGVDVVGRSREDVLGGDTVVPNGSNVAASRIIGTDDDESVSAAEAARNSRASGSFFLDPLLN